MRQRDRKRPDALCLVQSDAVTRSGGGFSREIPVGLASALYDLARRHEVLEQEPLPADHKLWTLPGALTPHTAGCGPCLDDRRWEIILDNCRHFLANQPLRNLVDKARWF